MSLPVLANATALPRRDVPYLPPEAFRSALLDETARGARLAALFGQGLSAQTIRLWAVLARDGESLLSLAFTEVGDRYPSLTPDLPEAHRFEREIFEQWRIRPEGHPWLKPIRFQRPMREGAAGERPEPGSGPFFRVEGDAIHEVAVGPVHAGVTEPGHFRFQCHGEEVIALEIALGYQHRGIEEALRGGPDRRTPHLIETLAGDTTAGHATAWAQVVEALHGARPSLRADALRALLLELERLANHTGDLGALAEDAGFLPTTAYCGRLRGDFLNLTALLAGNRFSRGAIRPGGVTVDLEPERAELLAERLKATLADTADAVEHLWNTPSVMARFEETGIVRMEDARRLGLVGPAARACGIARDVRRDFPSGIWRIHQVPVLTWESGDVFARAFVRWQEIQRSGEFLLALLAALPEGPLRVPCGEPAADRIAVALVEGWRGEICHVAISDDDHRFARYKAIDPSFRNWSGLELAMRGQTISDFPLCNKSFNLSYCGHDL